jgi:hypothetical protein
MDYLKYIVTIGVLIAVSVAYEKFKDHTEQDEQIRNYEIVKRYLVSDSSLAKSKLPILWIHNQYNVNARNWPSFFSRNTIDLNQPYILLTIKSIIDKCGGSFNVCLIDDDTFVNVIPGWNIDMSRVADPIKGKLRDLAMARILKCYGGLFVPPSFLCTKNLSCTYNKMTSNGCMMVASMVDRNSTSAKVDFMVSNKMMGCQKDCPLIDEYIQYLEYNASSDYTAESVFEGNADRWLLTPKSGVNVIDPKLTGSSDVDGNVVNIDRLIGNSFIDFSPNALGIYFPQCDILNRTDYQWFARLSARQAIESDTVMGKLLLISQ